MSALPAIGVVVPVFNGAPFLAETLRSVLAQEGVALRVRVFDNGSSDGSVAIAQAFADGDPRVTVTVNPYDIGYYGSLNRALSETEEPLFVPFAADDLMAPGNLAQKARAVLDTEAGFAHSTVRLIDEHGAAVGLGPDHGVLPEVLPAPWFFPRIAPENKVAPQSVVADTARLRALGGFDGRNLYAADWLTWMRLSLRHPVVSLGAPLVLNRVHAGSGTNSGNAQGWNGRDLPAALERIFADDAMPEAWRGWRDAMLAHAHGVVAGTLGACGLRRVADGWAEYLALGRALARHPWDLTLRARYERALWQTGLAVPPTPCEAIAETPRTPQEAAALAATLAELGALVARVLVPVAAGAAQDLLELVQPELGDTELDVVIAPGVAPEALLVPGRLAVPRWGSSFIAHAETAGVPVHPYALPDPATAVPDLALWEAVDAAAVTA